MEMFGSDPGVGLARARSTDQEIDRWESSISQNNQSFRTSEQVTLAASRKKKRPFALRVEPQKVLVVELCALPDVPGVLLVEHRVDGLTGPLKLATYSPLDCRILQLRRWKHQTGEDRN